MPISKKHKTFTWTFQTPEQMQAWGRRLARLLQPNDVVALIGPLGAGKTTLVQSVTAGWGYRRRATSPTFALVNEYQTPRGNVYHMDMYRLTPNELAAFPIEDYWESGLCLIEWADRIQDRWPSQTLELRFRHTSDDHRTVHFQRLSTAWKKRLAPLLAA